MSLAEKTDRFVSALLMCLGDKRLPLGKALVYFRRYKLDTFQIAQLCGVPEHQVVRKLNELRSGERFLRS